MSSDSEKMISEGSSEKSGVQDIALSITGLGKCYRTYAAPRYRLQEMILLPIKRFFGLLSETSPNDFWALQDFNLEVIRGESFGVIGANGSGKSTLLQMVSGTLTPSSGVVESRGKVAALLELGSGFNAEFTGRENIFTNAAVLGLNKGEIEAKFDQIVAFADIDNFIDQPVKNYSSGMLMRLAFAVVAHVDADILIVDEALSVGDVFFAQKCLRFFDEFKAAGGTVLLVSHDTSAVTKLCNRAALLSHGRLVHVGETEEVLNLYLKELFAPEHLYAVPSDTKAIGSHLSAAPRQFICGPGDQKPNQNFVSNFNEKSDYMGVGGAQILDAGYFDTDDERLHQMASGQAVRFSIWLRSNVKIKFPSVGLVVKDRLGTALFSESTTFAFRDEYERGLDFESGDEVRVDFEHIMPILMEGQYTVAVAVAEGYGHDHVQHHYMHEVLIIDSVGDRLLHGFSGFEALKIVVDISRDSVLRESPRNPDE